MEAMETLLGVQTQKESIKFFNLFFEREENP